MKQIGEPRTVRANNAWGKPTTTRHTTYEVENSDVGRFKDHYLGHNHLSYKFRLSDVGRQMIVMTDGTGWTCWSWK